MKNYGAPYRSRVTRKKARDKTPTIYDDFLQISRASDSMNEIENARIR